MSANCPFCSNHNEEKQFSFLHKVHDETTTYSNTEIGRDIHDIVISLRTV